MEPIKKLRAFVITWLVIMAATFAIFGALSSLPLRPTAQIGGGIIVIVIALILMFWRSFYELVGGTVMGWFSRR
jgi:divalent metal cation (Fe/Co/Zn/Cd) transporter